MDEELPDVEPPFSYSISPLSPHRPWVIPRRPTRTRCTASEADVAKAREAVDDLERATRQGDARLRVSVEVARGEYWIGGHEETAARRADLERGVDAGNQATSWSPAARGYFWMAANMGQFAGVVRPATGTETTAVRSRRRSKGSCRSTPPFQKGSADRALGRWHTWCRDSSAAARRSPKSTCAGSLTYGPDSMPHASTWPRRCSSAMKADAIPEFKSVWRAGQPGVGARGPRVQDAGRGAIGAKEALNRSYLDVAADREHVPPGLR